MGRCDTILVAACPDSWEYGVAVVVDGCDLVAGEVSVPGDAFALTGVNGLDTLRPA